MSDWSPNRALKALQQFLAEFGLREPAVQLVSFRQTAIYRLPGIGASLRVYGPGEDTMRGDRMIALAKYLAETDFPAIRLHPDFVSQPIDLAGLKASVWQWIEADRLPTDADLRFGRLLRSLHDMPVDSSLALPSFDPVRTVRQRLDRLERERKVRPEDIACLKVSLARAIDMGGELRASRLGSGLIHGDAMPGNMIISHGAAVLIDLDSGAWGGREWDLVPMAVVAKRFDASHERWNRFVAGYGADPRDFSGFEAATLIKQLTMTTYLCLSAGHSAEIDAEIRSRLRMWREWDLVGQWRSGFTVAAND
ncbi:MAG: phosphotransferase [Hyphomicrobiaceae bacterium]